MDEIDDALDELCSRADYESALRVATGYQRAEVLYWMGQPEAARSILRGDSSPVAALVDARCCWQADLYEEGLERLRSVAESPERKLVVLLIELCQGKPEPPSPEAVVAGLTGHRLARAYHDLGVCFQFTGRLRLACDYYSKAAQSWLRIDTRHPEAATALFGLSGSLETFPGRSSEFGETVEHFLKIASPVDSRRAQMVEALLAKDLDSDNLVRAERLIEDLHGLRPEPRLLLLLGKNRYLQGRCDEALSPIQAALGQYRKLGQAAACADCLWMLGRLQFSLGRLGWDASFREADQFAEPGSSMQMQIRKDWAVSGGAPGE